MADVYVYSKQDSVGATVLVVAGLLSALSATFVLGFFSWTLGKRVFQAPYVFTVPILVSLMLGDLLQAVGSVLNAKWVVDGAVRTGFYCNQQGSIKQTGNIAIAVWSFFIALHAFSTLFRRGKSSVMGVCLKIAFGWAFVLTNVLLGPFVLEDTQMKGPFLGISGLWCWITDDYPVERFFLEYFFEFLSIGLCFVLYGIILLRVRGNLYRSSAGWRLRFVPASETWKLMVTRDAVDQSVLQTVYTLIWYPVAYFVILLPVAITRFMGFAGQSVPLWAEIVTDTIFNLTGLVDALLLLRLRKLSPSPEELPNLYEKHQRVDIKSGSALRITPFTEATGGDGALTRTGSMVSTHSRQPLV